MDKFEVTGSYIPAALDERKAMPVQVIDTAAIQVTGINTNVLDVLRKSVPQIQGANNIGVENANISGGSTNGGSQVALRNTDTLVLVNGKRMAYSGVAGNGGYQFVDLNAVPLSAVERIEVLTDGASAIYGSDAVSGVVNIILKKEYRGAEFTFHQTAAPTDLGSEWKQRSASMTVGTGTDKTNVMFSAEWTKSDPLWQRDMAYEVPFYGTASYPGVIGPVDGVYYSLKSGLNAPATNSGKTLDQLIADGTYVENDDIASGFDLSQRSTIISAVDKRIATVNVNHKISDNVTVNADFLYAHTRTHYELNPQPVSANSSTLIANGITTLNTANVTVRNRFLGGPNRIYDQDTSFYRGTVGFEAKINEYFNLNAYANYNNSHQLATGRNQILNSALLAGIYSGKLNLFAINQDPAQMALANIYGDSLADYNSQLITYNAIANGKIFDLPGGPLQYAAGVEYRKETLTANADYNSIIPPGGTTSLWNNGVSLSKFDGSRHATSEFAEVNLPVFGADQNIPGLHILTLDGAVRHENYSDGNSVTVPKVSMRYLPFNDEFALRGTYSKSFTEPQLYSLYGPSGSGFTTSLGGLQAYDTSGTALGTNFSNLQGFQMSGSNPNLTPSHSKAYTVGFVYSPKFAKGLEVTVDYYNIDQTDLVGSIAGTTTIIQSVERYGPASPFANYVALNAFPGQAGATAVTTPGQLHNNINNMYVLQTLVNIGSQTQHGYDVDVRYTFPEKSYGRFVFDSRWTFMQTFKLDDSEYAGLDLYGALPKARTYTTLDWTYEKFGATLGYTWLKSVGDGYDNELGNYGLLDFQFRYDFGASGPYLKGVSFDIGVNNVLAEDPKLDTNNYSSPNFDSSAYSFFGRMYYADLKIRF